jgi:hypothetical protein
VQAKQEKKNTQKQSVGQSIVALRKSTPILRVKNFNKNNRMKRSQKKIIAISPCLLVLVL